MTEIASSQTTLLAMTCLWLRQEAALWLANSNELFEHEVKTLFNQHLEELK
jgi:hypothetical protein